MAWALRDQLDELLLADLYSLREIAARLEIDPETVRRRRMTLFAAGAGSRTFDRQGDVCVLAAGETLLDTPIRCRGACAGRIYILPCRACAALARLQRDRTQRQLGQLRQVKLRPADTAIGQRQRELFGADGPQIAAPKKRPAAIGAGARPRRYRPAPIEDGSPF